MVSQTNLCTFLQQTLIKKDPLLPFSNVRHQRAVFTVNTPTLDGRVQSYSDTIHIFPLIATDVPVQFSPFHEIQGEKPQDDD